jgi:uncharacterized protein
MNLKTLNRAALGAVLALGLVAAPAFAQREPAYDAARRAGVVGEKIDGYLGVIGGDASVRKMADEINIKRRAL